MEVSALQWLLNNIDSFLNLSISSCANLDREPLSRYYQNIEEILKLLRPVLDAITDVASVDVLKKAFLQLAQSVEECVNLFKTWHPLVSRLTFVLEAESRITNIRSCVLEIFRFLKQSNGTYPGGLSTASLGHCTQKVESIVCGHAEAFISEVIKDEAAGKGLKGDRLVEITDLLGIMSNQEIFIEAVALENLKENAEQAKNKSDMEYLDKLIALVMQLHDHLVLIKHSKNSTPVPVPADFCCPLSLDLMSDPVIVSSGQTYERVYISKWLDLGLSVCPKTRQSLGRANLTPNYTVKALIASWCEQNNVQLPDPVKSMSLNQPLTQIFPTDCGMVKDLGRVPRSTGEQTAVDQRRASLSPQVRRFGLEDSLDIERESLDDQSTFTEEKCLHPNEYESLSSSTEGFPIVVEHNRTASDTNQPSDFVQASQVQDVMRIGESSQLMRETHALRLIGVRSPNERNLRQTSEMPAPRIISSSAMEARSDSSRVENQVKRLMEDMSSSSVEKQREAAAELRVLAKQNMENRIIISDCGAIAILVKLLHSTDTSTQENTVTALLNLSLSDNNKTTIANAGAIKPLIHVLQTGSPEARENSAATLFSLSVIEENKLKIGRCGAISPLVELLANGSLSAKKDAITALYNLSILHENKTKIVEAGAIRHLLELMDPAAGMVDKAVAALANLATIPEGKKDIGQLGGIPVLVEVVELGSARGKENAAAALLQLCSFSTEFRSIALQEGVVPPLVALTKSGTARGKEKAQALLASFRSLRFGNMGRG